MSTAPQPAWGLSSCACFSSPCVPHYGRDRCAPLIVSLGGRRAPRLGRFVPPALGPPDSEAWPHSCFPMEKLRLKHWETVQLTHLLKGLAGPQDPLHWVVCTGLCWHRWREKVQSGEVLPSSLSSLPSLGSRNNSVPLAALEREKAEPNLRLQGLSAQRGASRTVGGPGYHGRLLILGLLPCRGPAKPHRPP